METIRKTLLWVLFIRLLIVALLASFTPRTGLFLIAAYLFCDGFTSTLQERLFKGYSMSTYQQMLYVNLVSGVFSAIGTISSPCLIRRSLFARFFLFRSIFSPPSLPLLECDHRAALIGTGEFFSSFAFSLSHPLFMVHSFGLSLCAVFGQMIIYTTIKEFGALVFSTIMTTRQFLNILLSCIIYLHPLSMGQWIGVAMVFGVLYYKSFDKKPSHGHGHGPKQPAAESEPKKPSADEKV
jgi:adenosine 3'-phospho 5'-phosphosulfate transporter B2